MDHTSEAVPGQPNGLDKEAHARELQHLCELVQLLRAWWENFESTIRDLDRSIAVRIHEVFVEAAITARTIARRLGVTLPDFSGYDWTPSVPAADRPAAFDL